MTVINTSRTNMDYGYDVATDGGASPFTVAAGVTLQGSITGFYDPNETNPVLDNFGTLIGQGVTTSGYGVELDHGGTVTNDVTSVGTSTVAGYITGSTAGVLITGGSGTVTNKGTIESSGLGIDLAAGGNVTNTTGAILRSGGGPAIFVDTAAGTVQNAGSISGTVSLGAGGTVTNAASGQMSSIDVAGASGNVNNSGVMVGGVTLQAGGSIDNSGGIGTAIAGFGTITHSPGGIYGEIVLGQGGNITNTGFIGTNGSTAIAGGTLGATHILNSGGIQGVVTLSGGGQIDNSGLMSGINYNNRYFSHSIQGSETGAPITVNNSGSIVGEVDFENGGVLTNSVTGTIDGRNYDAAFFYAAATVTNYGTITGQNAAVYFESGPQGGNTLTNYGLIKSTNKGVSAYATTATISNFGTIVGGSGSHKTDAGLYTDHGALTLTNHGTVIGGHGIYAYNSGGTFTNYGLISGTSASAIELNKGGTVNNFGSIVGGGSVVANAMFAAAAVQPGSAGTGAVIIKQVGGTVENAGTITGLTGTAVAFTALAGGDRLILDPGQVLQGVATAAGTGNILELSERTPGSTGTISGIGTTNYLGFDTIQVDTGANWTITDSTPPEAGGISLQAGAVLAFGAGVASGDAVTLAGHDRVAIADTTTFGGAISNFDFGDTLDLSTLGFVPGTSSVSYTNGVLTVTNGTTTDTVNSVQLAGDVNLNFATFQVSQDGTGTDVTLVPNQPSQPVLVTDSGVSGTDDVTNVAASTFTGTALPSGVVTLLDGSTVIGTGTAAADGTYSITSSPLSNGPHSISTSVEAAGTSSTPSSSLGVVVDTVAPVVTGTSTSGAGISGGSGDLNAGNVVTLTVATSEPVYLSGGTAAPTLSLNDGGTATLVAGGAGSNTLTFTTTISAGQNAADLAITGVALNGALATDQAGNSLNLSGITAPTPGTLQIDTIAPAVTTVAGITPNHASTVGAGASVVFTVGVSEPVTISGTPTLQLNNNEVATYDATASNPNLLVFDYTVKTGDNTNDLQVAGSNPNGGLALNGGSIVDGAGNQLVGSVAYDTGVAVVIAPPVTPPPPSDTVPPTVTFNPTVSLSSQTTVTFTGTVSDNVGVASLKLYEGTNLLGSATINTDGSWTYTTDLSPGFHTGLSAVATDTSGNSASAPSDFDLTTGTSSGLKDQPYTTVQDRYAVDGTFLGQTFFKANGAELFASTYTALPDGGSTYTYAGGTFFHGKSYSSFVNTYDANGTLAEDIFNNRDGSHTIGSYTIESDKSGQTVHSIHNDVFANDAPNTRFVFSKGFGHDTIEDFKVSGSGHDTLVLPKADMSHLAAIIASAHTAHGDTTIQVDKNESITLVGVTAAELKAHPNDIKFHA